MIIKGARTFREHLYPIKWWMFLNLTTGGRALKRALKKIDQPSNGWPHR